MNDSRIMQARGLIQDAQTVLSELGEELPRNNHLAATRFSLRLSLQHLSIFEDS